MNDGYLRKSTCLGRKNHPDGTAGKQGCYSDTGPVIFQATVSWECIWFLLRRRPESSLCGKWTPSPSSLLEQAFEILSRGRYQGFTADSLEPS
jgi:hypothetical protein